MSILTDGAGEIVEKLSPWVAFAAFAFIAYRLSLRVGWQDAIALTILLRYPCVALGRYAARPS